MIKITIEDTENRGEPLVLTGEFGFAVARTNVDEEKGVHTGSVAMGDAKIFGFIPGERVAIKSKKEHINYDSLIQRGDCFKCGKEVIDYIFVKRKIEELEEEYGVEIQQIGYDPWNAIATIQGLEEDGYECVKIKQHSSVLHMPTKWLKEIILQQEFQYMDNRMLEINFQNARCTEDTNKNKYVNKKKSAGKVDMVVALINAMYLLQQYILYGQDDFVVQTA